MHCFSRCVRRVVLYYNGTQLFNCISNKKGVVACLPHLKAKMGNKSSITSSSKETTTKQKVDTEIHHNKTAIQKVPAVRRNSATTTVASSTTSASTSKTTSASNSRTNTPPPPLIGFDVPVRRVSQKQRPRGVADMEIKSHCEQIKRIVGTSRLSNVDLTISTSDIILSSNDESVVYESFGNIIAIAQFSSSLEQGTLDDFHLTCDALRRKQPSCANKVGLLMSQAKASIEALVLPVAHEVSVTEQSAIVLSLLLSSSHSGTSDNHRNSSGNGNLVLSQHRMMNTTKDFLQDIRLQYDIACAIGANLSEINSGLPNATMMMDVNNIALPIPVVRSGPPPIQVTTVRPGPPPIQVTTIQS